MASNEHWALLDHHFSSPRVGPYLREARGDEVLATRLILWNSHVTAGFWFTLSYFEVGLRNALDARLVARGRKRGDSQHWIFDPSGELGRGAAGLDRQGRPRHKHPYQDVQTAITRVTRNKQPVNPGQVISEISFGFWLQLVSKSQTALWPDLAAAFPHAPDRARTTVHDPVDRIRGFRNRLGHHHRVWNQDLVQIHSDLLDVSGWIDPEFRAWLAARSPVPRLLTQRPD